MVGNVAGVSDGAARQILRSILDLAADLNREAQAWTAGERPANPLVAEHAHLFRCSVASASSPSCTTSASWGGMASWPGSGRGTACREDLGIDPTAVTFQPVPPQQQANGTAPVCGSGRPLTIAEARRGLAETFGVSEEAGEITIHV
jgi:hypothetical protein